MSEVVDLLLAGRRRLSSREAWAFRLMARRWIELENTLLDQIEDLTKHLLDMSPRPVSLNVLYQIRRYRRLLEDIDRELKKYRGFYLEVSRDHARLAALQSVDDSFQVFDSLDRVGIDVLLDRTNRTAIENAALLAAEEAPFPRLFDGAGESAKQSFSRKLVEGIGLGKNPRTIAHEAARLGLGVGYKRLATIYRTEMLRVYREQSRQHYIDAQVITGYKRRSARDSRVCIGCLMTDGEEFPLSHPFDQHPNCRCVMIPIVASRPVTFETGREWFARQSETFQRQLLGPVRYQLWQDGRDLRDFAMRTEHPIWGGAIVERPVHDLESMSLRAFSNF